MFLNIFPEALSCVAMAGVAWVLLRVNDGMVMPFVWIAVCALAYFAILCVFPQDRMIVLGLKKRFLSGKSSKKKT